MTIFGTHGRTLHLHKDSYSTFQTALSPLESVSTPTTRLMLQLVLSVQPRVEVIIFLIQNQLRVATFGLPQVFRSADQTKMKCL